ncbi:penicillin-binding transpeptidase domain-containing protein [Romboutsia weinsteinii]|uniref:Penicillin-binding transpeptidase domain-containing protein n=1 Tax=Romboutsia weinsteinii TaxID=2020949 RepID=A0A371J0Z4_9FIRM|nr:penicillin-binding transpeptidase domain-containing protein [Romboutsia weinsteinii]RDY26472.1 penicillin-binding transpeptidase domain-containing protein [Romboutsia weinsteinii]
MGKKVKKISILVLSIILSSVLIIGCSNGDKASEILTKYQSSWIAKNYEGMYELLSSDSKEYISKEDFVKKYNNIYSAIGANNIKIKLLEENKSSDEINFSLSMNTILGDMKFDDFKVNIVKEDKDYKIKWDESLIFPQMIEGDKVRVQNEHAKRGSIFDRNDELLAGNGIVKLIGIHPSIFETNKDEKIKNIASILDISEEVISKKLDANSNPEHLVEVVSISSDEADKINELVGIKGVKVLDKNSRIYAKGEATGNLVGYIGAITSEELEKGEGKGYSSSSLIGKGGLEKVYDDKLRGSDGGHIYIERGDEQITVSKKEAKNGEDIKLSIDLGLQTKIYSEMNREKGASTAIDPKTGEVLAMVSSPSYDSNTLVTYTSKTQADVWKQSEKAEFNNRANDVYSPGSTMKLITAAIGLESGAINPDDAMNIDGLNWQKSSSWGDYKITRVKDKSPINLKDAMKYSDNIYFADKAIKVGSETFVNKSKDFGIGEDMKFEYPMAKSQISNDGSLEKEILLADTGYGQGEVLMSPLDVALAYSAIGNEGNIMQPRLVVSKNNEPKVWKKAIDNKYLPVLVDSCLSVVNDEDGAATDAKIEGINIAGKTGTAEIKNSKEDTSGSENGWFVALNTDDSKIVVSMIIEDVKSKGGSTYVVPKVKNAMQYYLTR